METPIEAIKPNAYKGRGLLDFNKSIDAYILAVLSQKALTRDQLSKMTSIPRTTLFDHLKNLLLKEQIVKFTIPSKRRGRNRIYYKLNPDFKVV